MPWWRWLWLLLVPERGERLFWVGFAVVAGLIGGAALFNTTGDWPWVVAGPLGAPVVLAVGMALFDLAGDGLDAFDRHS